MASCWFLYNNGGSLGYRAQSSLSASDCRRAVRFPYPLTDITISNIYITISNMMLGDKLRYLREIEGTLRGLGRAMTQQEIVRSIREEFGKTISQSYLSQIESGARPHLTNSTRMLLARFFKVHPGYLVDDPEGYSTELVSDVGAMEDKMDLWLINGAERFHRDLDLHQALVSIARHEDSRMCLVLLGAILDNPGLAERLLQVLKPPAERSRRNDLD
jgi:transcriptional regulator with XRE-family HTH domain